MITFLWRFQHFCHISQTPSRVKKPISLGLVASCEIFLTINEKLAMLIANDFFTLLCVEEAFLIFSLPIALHATLTPYVKLFWLKLWPKATLGLWWWWSYPEVGDVGRHNFMCINAKGNSIDWIYKIWMSRDIQHFPHVFNWPPLSIGVLRNKLYGKKTRTFSKNQTSNEQFLMGLTLSPQLDLRGDITNLFCLAPYPPCSL